MVKSLLKTLLIKTTGPRLQQAIRQFYLTRQIVTDRSFREPEMDGLKKLVMPGDVVADIGANAGGYTRELSLLVGPGGKVYSFEPVPDTFAVLQNVVRKAGLNNVVAFQCALASEAKQDKIVIPQLDGFTGYYWAHLAQPGDAGKTIDVEVKIFDQLAQEQSLDRLGLVKCDVEGSELDVLQGSCGVISRFKPGWLIEVSQATNMDVFKFLLQGHGYRAFVYQGGFVETLQYRDTEYSNYFFLHPDSLVWRRARMG